MTRIVTAVTTGLALLFTLTQNANATSFDFTGYSGSNLGITITELSSDESITATISSDSGVSAFNLDGLGVAGGGYRSIQGNETLHIDFDFSVDIETLHLRQWEGPDDAIITLTFSNHTTQNILVTDDNGGIFNTNEYVALNAFNVVGLSISGIDNGTVLGIPKTQFFVAGIQGVQISEVPLPAALGLFCLSFACLIGMRRYKYVK